MPDTLVLAEISIDSSGVVRGMAVVDRALDQGSKRLNQYGNESEKTAKKADLLNSRLFNMKNAVSAALGGATLAGGILAIKNLGEQAFRAQENFGMFDKALGRAETSIFRAVGRVTGLNDTLRDTATILDAVSRSADSVDGQEEGTLLKRLWGTTEIGAVQNLIAAQAALIRMQDPKYDTGGALSTAKPWEKLGALNVPAGPGASGGPPGPYTSGLYGPPALPFAQLVGAVPAIGVPEGPFGEDLDWLDEAREKIARLTGDVFHLNDALAAMPDSLKQLPEAFEQTTSSMKHTIEVTEFWQSTLATGVSLLSSAISDSGQSARQAIGALFQTMSQMAFSFMAMHIAAAVGATTWLGAAITGGTTAQHKASAAKWGAAGLLTGLAARQFGRGGGGEGSGYGGAGGGPSPLSMADQRSSRGTPNVNITINGSLLGTSKEQLARDITKLWRDGVRDQGGGPSFVNNS